MCKKNCLLTDVHPFCTSKCSWPFTTGTQSLGSMMLHGQSQCSSNHRLLSSLKFLVLVPLCFFFFFSLSLYLSVCVFFLSLFLSLSLSLSFSLSLSLSLTLCLSLSLSLSLSFSFLVPSSFCAAFLLLARPSLFQVLSGASAFKSLSAY